MNVRPTPDIDAVSESRFLALREQMVERQLCGRDIVDRDILDVMRRLPRHRFVTPEVRDLAYADRPLPILAGQTISQPYIVALMTQLVRPTRQSRALEIGAGSGYQSAVLAELCGQVYSLEIVPELAEWAAARLCECGYRNITVRLGDGYRGWPDEAPFDIIVVAAAPDHVPPPLLDQLSPGGRLVIPVGIGYQSLLLITKSPDGVLHEQVITPVAFVPMTGEAQSRSRR